MYRGTRCLAGGVPLRGGLGGAFFFRTGYSSRSVRRVPDVLTACACGSHALTASSHLPTSDGPQRTIAIPSEHCMTLNVLPPGILSTISCFVISGDVMNATYLRLPRLDLTVIIPAEAVRGLNFWRSAGRRKRHPSDKNSSCGQPSGCSKAEKPPVSESRVRCRKEFPFIQWMGSFGIRCMCQMQGCIFSDHPIIDKQFDVRHPRRKI